MRGTWRRRLGAWLLALCLCLSLLPAAALAAGDAAVGGEGLPVETAPDKTTDGSDGPPDDEADSDAQKPGEPTPPGEAQTPVSYIEYTWDEETGTLSHQVETVSSYKTVTAEDTAWGTADDTATWYVATGEVTIGTETEPQRVTVTGTVNLILTDGCTLTVHGGIRVAENDSLTIYGQSGGNNQGQLIATAAAGSGDAGIGGNANQSCGAITIHGGTVTATGGSGTGSVDAGGSDDGSSGDAGDSGSTGGGAGIGSGANGDMSTSAGITISGKADVTATAGGDGAAIGTGAGGDMSSGSSNGDPRATITIQDKAVVTATASGGGAAIGTGKDGTMQGGNNSKSEITITDEVTVTATAEGGGAAIGSGAGIDSGGGRITISSENSSVHPTVTATAQKGGAAIGSGAGADLYTEIRIIGPATVTATASGGGAAIGSGQNGDMAGSGRIKIDNGETGAQKVDTSYSPVITARVSSGAAAVIGCGENGSIGPAPDITIGGTAEITLCENNPTSAGYVPAPAIGAGGYPEGKTPTNVKGTITIRNNNEEGASYDSSQPTLTLYGTGEIGPQSAFETIEIQLSVHDGVSIKINCMVAVTAGAGGAVSGGGEFKKGSTVTVTATPGSGYRFVRWTENGETVSTNAAYTFSAAGNRALTAEFAQLPAPSGDGGSSSGGDREPTYRPDVEQPENGEVTVTPRNPERGDDVTVTPEPDEGYEVDTVTVTDRNGNEVEVTDNGDGTWTFEQPRGRVTISVTFREIPPEPLPFTDVPAGAWYEDAVRYVWENGLMTGVSASRFDPDGTTTRGQIVTILWRLSGSPQVNYPMDFTDVSEGDYYAQAVRWAVSAGIAAGYGDGRFGPGDPITREQLAVMLYRCAQHEGYDVSVGGDTNILSYTDAFDVSEFAISAMQWACGAGIITGTGDGSTLSPQGQATRAQAAAMLQRFCELDR